HGNEARHAAEDHAESAGGCFQLGAWMKPYYDHAGITIYHGDCREVLPQIEQPPSCIVDPVWPNSVFPSVADPFLLFAETCDLLTVKTLIVHLGCASDPRFLCAVPKRFPFVR